MAPISTVTASQDYKNLMDSILGKTINQGVQREHSGALKLLHILIGNISIRAFWTF
jgi:hypothetical protein